MISEISIILAACHADIPPHGACELHRFVSDGWKKEMKRWGEKGRNFASILLPETAAHAAADMIVQCRNSRKAHIQIQKTQTNIHIFIIHHVRMTVK